jgi:hypothetical protein
VTAEEQIAPGWLHTRRVRPDLVGRTPAELLAETAKFPGTARLGTANGSEVFLLAEVSEGMDRVEQRLDEEVVEAALDSVGWPWRRRQHGWVIPASAHLPREIEIIPEEAGLRVQAVLVDWDDLGADERRALAWMLCRAQLGLRFCRGELAQRQALLAGQLAVRDVECGLANLLGGTAAGLRLLGREAGDLLLPGLASVYLHFQENSGKIDQVSP